MKDHKLLPPRFEEASEWGDQCSCCEEFQVEERREGKNGSEIFCDGQMVLHLSNRATYVYTTLCMKCLKFLYDKAVQTKRIR